MSNQESPVGFLSLDYGVVNPNHKLKLWASVTLQNYWITNVAFNKDKSIYLAPQLERPFTITGVDKDDGKFSFESLPGEDIHVSLHGSGVVNITVRENARRLRTPQQHSSLEVITLGIKDPTGLKVATDDEISTLPGRYKPIPVTGFFRLSPVFITIFRVPSFEKWQMPHLSRTIQIHVGFKLRGTETRYEIVVWQNSNIPDFLGDIALSLGS